MENFWGMLTRYAILTLFLLFAFEMFLGIDRSSYVSGR